MDPPTPSGSVPDRLRPAPQTPAVDPISDESPVRQPNFPHGSDDRRKNRLSGKVVRSSSNSIVAVAPGIDPSSGSFVALEASPGHPDRYALVRIPLNGGAKAGGMQQFRTWPVDNAGAPLSPHSFFVEELPKESVGFAFAGPDGVFGAGRVAPKPTLSKFRDRSKSESLFPHLACLDNGITPACFTAEGRLFIAGEPFAETE